MTAKKKPVNNQTVELTKQLEDAQNARLRIASDYANLERRIADERASLRASATASLLEELFPIFDNFYRASLHAPNIKLEDLPKLTEDDFKKILNYFQGLKMIEKQREEVLSSVGRKRIATKGQPFDPNLHEAVSAEANSEVPPDHIIDEIEAGWQIGDKVIRPAKVRVSQG